MIRPATVAGTFYPGDAATLSVALEKLLSPHPLAPERVSAVIAPHAGYVYSGECAGQALRRVMVPRTVVIVGVNHHGSGHPLAVDSHSGWQTPLGTVPLDRELGEQLIALQPLFAFDARAGLREHSLEVQVPFLQYLRPDVRILPITVACHDEGTLLAAGTALGRLLAGNREVLILASTDMSHYLPAAVAARLDRLAIAAIEALDPPALFATVRTHGISMCGVAPTTLALAAAIAAGAIRVEPVCYTHSGKATGDEHEVVAYYSALIR